MAKVFINSLPKSGTNLLQGSVEKMGLKYTKKSIAASSILGSFYLVRQLIRGTIRDKVTVEIGLEVKVSIAEQWLRSIMRYTCNNCYVSGHANYSEHFKYLLDEYNFKTIYIIRDPRDVILSWIHYAKKEKKHLLHQHFLSLNLNEAIEFILYGGKTKDFFTDGLDQILKETILWVDDSNKKNSSVLIVKFEDLVGEKGGGSKQLQINTLKQIANFLDLEIEKIDFSKISEQVFGQSHTFRKGKINGWKEELSNDMIRKINSHLEVSLQKLGYQD